MAVGNIVPAVVSGTEGASIVAHAGKLRVTIDKKGYRVDGEDEPRAARRGR